MSARETIGYVLDRGKFPNRTFRGKGRFAIYIMGDGGGCIGLADTVEDAKSQMIAYLYANIGSDPRTLQVERRKGAMLLVATLDDSDTGVKAHEEAQALNMGDTVIDMIEDAVFSPDNED